ncbi:hypothetical protein GCM10009715_34450 [Paeniglutamicibacter psychrophenolicus]
MAFRSAGTNAASASSWETVEASNPVVPEGVLAFDCEAVEHPLSASEAMAAATASLNGKEDEDGIIVTLCVM